MLRQFLSKIEPKESIEYVTLKDNAKFIDETLSVLKYNDFISKKTYFMENQEDIAKVIKDLNVLYQTYNLNDEDEQDLTLFNLLRSTIVELEKYINIFKEELKKDVSEHTKEEKISINDNDIDKFEFNTSNVEDEIAKKIKKDLDSINEQKSKYMNSNTVKYLITSQDLSDVKFVSGLLTKNALNNMITRSGIENARVFELKELPTENKVIQKIVTVLK